jgi:hypothetical protein
MRDDYSVLLDCESSTMVVMSIYTTMAVDPRLAEANRKALGE